MPPTSSLAFSTHRRCNYARKRTVSRATRGNLFTCPPRAGELLVCRRCIQSTVCISGIKLRLAFYNEAPSFATFYNRLNEFKPGRTNLTEYLREGRPSMETTEHISAVRLLKETDKRVIYQQI
ncbi:hypothetical protein EVAR_12558_1 [Eumeta japonica]|uniref:Uncharacterized protein n=1 Tax=Eumeta variegata TaxID=151549 RepID=A0A4C1TPT7_EUMVA|nr:hypothetical protein EVAR_12558_1 [Eumeta japonica]